MATKLYGMILCATLMVLLTATTSRASTVTSSNAGTLLLDGFEGDTPGTNPSGWTSTLPPDHVEVETSGSHAAPIPSAAYYGSNFLALRGDGGLPTAASYNFSSAQASGTLTAQFAFYLPSESSANFGTNFDDATLFGDFIDGSEDSPLFRLAHQFETDIGFVSPNWITGDGVGTPVGTGGQVAYYDGSSYTFLTTGAATYTFTLGAWHVATITDNIDTGALTVNVDGTNLGGLTPNGLATTNVTGFAFYQNTIADGIGFADAQVPEPASMSLLALGGVLLLKRRRV